MTHPTFRRVALVFRLALLLFALPTMVSAQQLVAYHIVGKVTYNAAGATKEVVMTTRITPETVVNIPYGGKLELLDETNQKRIMLKTPGKGSVKAMSAQGENSVLALSSKYVAYVKKQLGNKGLTSKQRYTDFATVTRETDSLTAPKAKNESPLAARFNRLKEEQRKKYEDFRTQCNRKYNEFVRKAWEKFGAEPPYLLPDVPKIDPVIYHYSPSDPRPKDEERVNKNMPDTKVAPAPPVVPTVQPKPIQEIKPQPIPEPEKEFATMPFIFFGNELEVHLDETRRINISKVTPDNVADILDRLATPEYDNLLADCLRLRKEMNLCDWAYLNMLQEITDQFCGAGTNEATILLGYLYYQSGYKMRFAANGERMHLLIASQHNIYGKTSYIVDGERFYPLDLIDGPLTICRASFPREQSLSLFIAAPQHFLLTEPQERTITSKLYNDFGFTVTTNRSLMDFYENYPASCINEDFTTRWVINANTPMTDEVKEQIYPTLRKQIEGLSEVDAVGHLLNLVQTGLDYKRDDDVWGYDRTFFAEESMHYPFCDCEDRAVLFTRLVRDLLGLECVLIYYPGHLASAVHFTTPVKGDYYELQGKDFTVCDPAYINAGVGMQMPSVDNTQATLIPIK